MRASSLARYLPEAGIRLDVLTTRNASAVGADPKLLESIPAAVTIHRTTTLDLPFAVKKRIKRLIAGGKKSEKASRPSAEATGNPNIVKRALENILLPDPQVTWLPILTRAARRIVKKREIDLVLITVPPFSSVLLVEKLRRTFPGLAIVADFRDEWLKTAFDLVSFLFSRSARARAVAARAEAGTVKNATAIVAVTEAARRVIRSRYPAEPEEKFRLIPNGFDAEKLRAATSPTETRRDDRIVVAYLGTLYASTEPTWLVEALLGLPQDLKSRFLFRFIGHIEDPRFKEDLLRLGDMVEVQGFLPQRAALAAMYESDYMLLILHDPLNVSAKFYEYLGAGKPILACVHPEGELRRLVEELRAGWWVDGHDVESIRRLFTDIAMRGSSASTLFRPDVEKIAQYERRALARRYADLMRSIAGKETSDSTDMTASAKTGN